MKILFLLDSLGAGGAESSLMANLPYYRKAGVEAIVACFSLKGAGSVFSLPIRKHADLMELSGANRRERCLALRNAILATSPDIVHASLLESSLISRFACIGLPVTLVNSLVNTPYTPLRYQNPKTNRFKHRLLQVLDSLTGILFVDAFHAVNHAVKFEAVRRQFITEGKITVVERGRAAQTFEHGPKERAQIRDSLGLSESDFVVLNLGRQCYQKGQIYLLQAMERLNESLPDAICLLAGREGDCTPQLQKWLQVHPGVRVRVLGHRDDVGSLLAAADLFVFPSLFEGIGGAAIEAMAASLPVVASDIPGLRETLGPQSERNFVPVKDPMALSEAIAWFYKNPQFKQSQARANKERFLSNYQMEAKAEEFLEFYRSLMAAKESHQE